MIVFCNAHKNNSTFNEIEKNMNKIKIFFLGVLIALITSCTSSDGAMDQRTETSAVLKENNYTLIKAGAKGESRGFKLLGFLPFVSPNYATAKSRLYDDVGQSLEGRSVALANQTKDSSFMYFILFSIPKLSITADVVEFKSSHTESAVNIPKPIMNVTEDPAINVP